MTVIEFRRGSGRRTLEKLLREAAATPTPPRRVRTGAAGCLGVGILTAVLGLLFAPAVTWPALLTNLLFWVGVAQGGVAFAALVRMTHARWSRAAQHIAASLGVFLPIGLILVPLLGLGRNTLFRAALVPEAHPWLGVGWALARAFLALAVMTGVSLAFLYFSSRPDLGALHPAERAEGIPGLLLRNWRGREAERERSRRALRYLSPLVLGVLFVAGASLAIDLGLTAETRFAGTLFPVMYVVSSLYAAVGIAAALAAAWRRSGPAAREILRPEVFGDLGNVLWALAIAFGYLWWCRYLIVWMTNLPGEAAHHLLRWQTWPWSLGSWTSLVLGAGLPLVLLFSGAVKRHAVSLAGVGTMGALGVFLFRGVETLAGLGITQGLAAVLMLVGVSLGFLGAAALAYLWLSARVPPFPVEDLEFVEALAVRDVRV